uniref:Putative ovule protein n=1 Tax=Solanum chacoense TaxID=4108 RepID=A0A0V0GJC2_SOLCH
MVYGKSILPLEFITGSIRKNNWQHQRFGIQVLGLSKNGKSSKCVENVTCISAFTLSTSFLCNL